MKKGQRILAILLVGVMLFGVLPITVLASRGGSIGNNITWDLNELTGVLRVSGTGNIPDFDGTSPGWRVFSNDIKTIIIDDGIDKIGNYAFYNCKNVETVEMPDSILEIGKYSFAVCEKLNGISLSSDLKKIGYGAFYACSSLENISIPSKVNSIAYEAFRICSQLKSIEVSKDNEYYSSISGVLFNKAGNTILQRPSGKTQTLYILPANVTHISDEAFFANRYLETILVDVQNKNFSTEDGVLFNESKSVLYCYPGGKTDEIYEIPEGVEIINNEAFGYSSLFEIRFPKSVEVISNRAFAFCNNVESVILPNSLVAIRDEAFSYCSKLENITIPATVNTIGKDAFLYSDNAVITCGKSSFVHSYALENNIPVKIGIMQMGIDNNGFYNSHSHFINDDEKSIYHVTKTYMDTIKSLDIDKNKKNDLIKETKSTWNGSCFGISASMALTYWDTISLSHIMKDVKPMPVGFYVDAQKLIPAKNPEFRGLINYYHILQGVTSNWYNKGYWKNELIAIVELAKRAHETGEPFLISYLYREKNTLKVNGHTVVGSDYSKGDGGHWVTLVDPNKILDYTYLWIDEDFSSFEVASKGSFEYSMWAIDSTELDDFNKFNLNNHDRNFKQTSLFATTLSEKYVTLSFSANHNITIKNGEGKKLIYTDGDISGDMDVKASRFVVNDTEVTMYVDVAHSDKFVVDDMSGIVNFGANFGDEGLYSIENIENCSSIEILENGEMKINGTSLTGKVHIISDNIVADILAVEFEDADNISFTGTNEGIKLSGARLKDATITYYADDEENVKSVVAENNQILISSKSEDNPVVVTPTPKPSFWEWLLQLFQSFCNAIKSLFKK